MDIVKLIFNLSLNLAVMSMVKEKTFRFSRQILRGVSYMIYMVATGTPFKNFPEFSLIKKIP